MNAIPPSGCGALRRSVGAAALAGGLLLAAVGCNNHSAAPPQGKPSQTKLQRNVELTRAQRKSIQYHVDTVGYLEAEGQTDIAAGVSGVVDEVLFREGQWVDRDTILVKVDQRRYQAGADVARANEKRALAALDLARDFEYRARTSGRGASDEERAKATLGLRVAEAELQGAVNSRVLAEHNLSRSQVRAPYPGQVNQRRVTPGTFVEDKAVIATIADLSRLRLVGWVPEKAAPTARELLAKQELGRAAWLTGCCLAGPSPWGIVAGLAVDGQVDLPSDFLVEFTLLPFPDRKFRGRVFYLSTVASPDTHMVECKAEVRTGVLTSQLRPGYTARIQVPLRSNPGACVVPEESVRASEKGFIAFVPMPKPGPEGRTDWVASARTLDLGYRAGGLVEVLKGIAPGEWIVQRGAEALEDNTPLRIPEDQAEAILRSRTGPQGASSPATPSMVGD